MEAPFIHLMYAARHVLEDGGALAAATGIPDMKIRWSRNRYTTRQERPCTSIAFVSDQPVDSGSVALNPGEIVRELALDLIVDLAVETEASAESNRAMEAPLEDYDPSGLSRLAMVLNVAMKLLRDTTEDPLRDTTDLGRKCDWVQNLSIDDDEDLPDDDGRLVGRINVIYRTSSLDPMVLLEREF